MAQGRKVLYEEVEEDPQRKEAFVMNIIVVWLRYTTLIIIIAKDDDDYSGGGGSSGLSWGITGEQEYLNNSNPISITSGLMNFFLLLLPSENPELM